MFLSTKHVFTHNIKYINIRLKIRVFRTNIEIMKNPWKYLIMKITIRHFIKIILKVYDGKVEILSLF